MSTAERKPPSRAKATDSPSTAGNGTMPLPEMFDSFFVAAHDYIDFVTALRQAQSELLQAEREQLATLREELANGPASDFGARCFELVRQLVYREAEPQIVELCRLRNEKLRQQHAMNEANGGWSREEKKLAFFAIHDKAEGRKAERKLTNARREMEEKYGVTIGRSTALEYLSERQSESCPAPPLD